MRLAVWCCLVVSSFAFAQASDPKKEAMLKEAKRIADLMKEDGKKPPSASPTATPVNINRGGARLVLASSANKPADYDTYLRLVTDEKLLQEAVDTVNGLAALPRTMDVNFQECGKPNASFSPKTGNITYCYELVRLFDQLASSKLKSAEDRQRLIRGAVFFVFFHEFGHALIHELKLPTTGREEDVVDQFATLLLLEQGERGEEAALAGAAFFLLLSEATEGKPAFWDEHSLDQQRFFNISCWLYGASPFRQVNLVAQGLLPAARAARCGDEFTQLRSSWKTIAEPKLKRPFREPAPR